MAKIETSPTAESKSLAAEPKVSRGAGSFWRTLRRATLVLIMAVAAAWGCWRFTQSTVQIEDEETIADLDGFESTPVYKKLHRDDEPADNRVHQNTGRSVRYQDPMFSLSSGTMTPPGASADEDSANVWFTGTIEEIEPVERIQMPNRISDRPDHSFHAR